MTAPALALDGGKHIGRVYRRPGSDLPRGVQFDSNGRPFLRHKDALAAVLNGEVFPSITNIVGVRDLPHLVNWAARKAAEEAAATEKKWPGLIAAKPTKAVNHIKEAANRDRDAAALQGDNVHNACENYARGLPVGPLTDAENRHLDGFKAFCDKFQPDFLGLEVTVYGRTLTGLRYAGTTDFVARINDVVTAGDYKTTRSGIHGQDVARQVSAVAHADEFTADMETLHPMFDVQAGVVLHLNEEGYQCAPLALGGETWSSFSALREVWDGHVFDKHGRDEVPFVGKVMRGPELVVPTFQRPQQPVAA